MRTGIVISDIHMGATDVDKSYIEISEIFLKYIKEENFDFLVITGDFFDHKLFLNDKESIVSYKLLKEIIDICNEKNAKLRIVYGTESHECNQYDLIPYLNEAASNNDNVKVIKQLQEEDLFDDLKVLYIPEEYLFNKDEYYNEYLSKKDYYDYVFGHGVIREVMKDVVVSMENKSTENSKRQKVPVFSSAELSYCCKGQVFFGHYHINQNIQDKVFYVGSFSRWKFGEEQEKGFYKITKKKDEYNAYFIENTMAPKFVTIGYGYDSDVFKNTENMDAALSHIDKLVKDKVFDNVRVEFNIPSDIENPESTINYIKNRYKFNDKFKVHIVHGYIDDKKEQQNEKLKEEFKKYSFIDDKSLSLGDKVARFIRLEYSKEVPLDDIEDILYKAFNDIISSMFNSDDKPSEVTTTDKDQVSHSIKTKTDEDGVKETTIKIK